MNLNEVEIFTFEIIGDSTGEKYFGTFECLKRLSHGRQLAKDRIVRDLLGPNSGDASVRAKSQADIIASCQVSLLKCPDWLKEAKYGLELADDNVLAELEKNIVTIQAKALLEIQKKADAAKDSLKETLKKSEE